MRGPGGPPPGGPDGSGGPPPGGSGGPPGRGPGGPGGMGPGDFLSPQVLAVADLNKDGRLTAEEALQAAEGFVRDADKEKKGTVGLDELRTALNGRFRGPGGPPGGGPGGPPEGFASGASLAPKILQAADANKDGRLSPDEAADAAARAVREEDKSRDGALDFETFYRALNRRLGHGAPLGLGTAENPARGHGPGDMQAITLLEHRRRRQGRPPLARRGRRARREGRPRGRRREDGLDRRPGPGPCPRRPPAGRFRRPGAGRPGRSRLGSGAGRDSRRGTARAGPRGASASLSSTGG